MKINQVLLQPLLTEKSTNLVKMKQYSFLVAEDANKDQLKTTIEKIYQVKVSNVRIIVRKGKIRRVGRKGVAKKTSNQKIAIVSLKEGKIDLFPQA